MIETVENCEWLSGDEKNMFLKEGTMRYNPKKDPLVGSDGETVSMIYVPTKEVDKVLNVAGSGEACISSFFLAT
jgi:hypothetical protein